MVFNLQRYDKVSTLLSLVSVFWPFVVGFWPSLASNGKKSVIFARLIYHNSMNMGQLREKYERFRQWQQHPMNFHMSEESHCCNNCGMEFIGNYCPCCSQRAGVGRIGWRSVRQSVMDIWGLGTRSLLNTAWQLLSRPGYLISDYISGKRQICFPPVKMLFILAVAFALISHWLFPNLEAFGYGLDLKNLGVEGGDEMAKMLKPFYDWYETHFSWVMLGLSFIAIFPTWVMFRYAPRHTRHTLPEGFFIQVLFMDLQMVISLLALPCWFFFNQWTIISVSSLILMVYYIIGYSQLFGYSLWGVLWRQAFVAGFIWGFSTSLVMLFLDINAIGGPGLKPEQGTAIKYFFSFLCLIFAVMVLATGYIINLIATRKARKELKRL